MGTTRARHWRRMKRASKFRTTTRARPMRTTRQRLVCSRMRNLIYAPGSRQEAHCSTVAAVSRAAQCARPQKLWTANDNTTQATRTNMWMCACTKPAPMPRDCVASAWHLVLLPTLRNFLCGAYHGGDQTRSSGSLCCRAQREHADKNRMRSARAISSAHRTF